MGVDSFVYTAADPAGKTSREATVTITILKPTEAAQYTRYPETLLQWRERFDAVRPHIGIPIGKSRGFQKLDP